MSEHPIHFVFRDLDRHWPDLANGEPLPSPPDLVARCRTGPDNWIIQGYAELARRGLPVRLGTEFRPGEVCVAHYDHIAPSPALADSFVISVRADRPRTFVSDWQVIQSPSSGLTRRDYYIPHYPQSNLIPRDSSRPARVQTVGYMGELKNVAARFRSPEFGEDLARLGAKLVIRGHGSWHDFSDIDLVLAVRDGTRHFLASKPATKLTNAWLAGVPALVGDEPAFAHIREGPLDYIHVSTQQDVLNAVARLNEDPDLYLAMVENGRLRGREYTRDRITDLWVEFLFNVIPPSYEAWLRGGGGIGRSLRYRRRAFVRRLWGERYYRGYDENGRKITLLDKLKMRLPG